MINLKEMFNCRKYKFLIVLFLLIYVYIVELIQKFYNFICNNAYIIIIIILLFYRIITIY